MTGRGGTDDGGGRETCTVRFLAAMIGSGRQYLLNRCRVSRCGYFLLRWPRARQRPSCVSFALSHTRRRFRQRSGDDRSIDDFFAAEEGAFPLRLGESRRTNYFARWRDLFAISGKGNVPEALLLLNVENRGYPVVRTTRAEKLDFVHFHIDDCPASARVKVPKS